MFHTMSLAVPTALRASYDQLATMSPAVAQRYIDVATVVQPAFTPAEFAIWTQHCLQLAQSGWRAWESVDAFLQLSPFLQQRLVVDDLQLARRVDHRDVELPASERTGRVNREIGGGHCHP